MAIEDFDDMFKHVGGYGKYQKILVLLSFPFNVFYSFMFFNQLFYTPIGDHWCHVPALNELSVNNRLNLSAPMEIHGGKLRYSRCMMYDVNYTQVLEESLVPDSSWPITKCLSGWEYDMSQTYSTIVSELNWVCEADWKASMAQTICFAGSILGTLVFGWAADQWGRLPVLIVSNLLACASGIATAFAHSFLLFTILRFLSGLAIDSFYTMMYIILQEYVSSEHRSMAANLPIAVFLTFGLVILPWIAYFIWNWRILAIVLSAPMAIVLIAPWTIPESGRWLLSKGRIVEAEKILRDVARTNNKEVPEQIYKEFRVISEKQGNTKQHHTFLDLFKTPTLRFRMIVIIVVWMLTSLCYDGHVRNINNLDYSIYITFTIAGILELPADLITIFLLECLGRRWTTSVTLLMSGLVYLVASGIAHGDPMPIACLAMIGRFFITMTMNAIMQYTTEIVPTTLRAQGSSLVHVSGHIATCFSPYIIYLGTQEPFLPFVILGIASAVGGGLALFLPETANLPLPSVAAEAEVFALGQPLCFLPCLQHKKQKEIKSDDKENAEVACEESCTDSTTHDILLTNGNKQEQ